MTKNALIVLYVLALLTVVVGLAVSQALTPAKAQEIDICGYLYQIVVNGFLARDNGVTVVVIYLTPEQIAEFRAQYESQCGPFVDPTSTPTPTDAPTAEPSDAPTNTPEPTRVNTTPGCDMFMPDTIGMVRTVDDTPIFYAPDARANTTYVIPAGQTARLVEQRDEWFAVVWACDVVWVRGIDGLES